jgi:PPP family 3-phenylpropionic acid transporter
MPASSARLATVYFWYFAVLGGFMPFFSLYLHDTLGLSPAAIGGLMAATLAARLLAPPFWGYVGDRTGRHLLCVRFGCGMLALVWLLLCRVEDTTSLALVLLAYSFFQNAVLAQFEAVTVQQLGAGRERYGQVRLWGSLGFIVAVIALGQLFEVVALAWLPVILAGLSLLLFASVLMVRAPVLPAAAPACRPLREVLQQRGVAGFLGAAFLLQLSHAPYNTFYSVYLAQAGYASADIGGLWAIAVVAEVLAFSCMHRFLPGWGERQVLQGVLLLAALRWIVIGMMPASPVALLMMQLLHGACFAASHCACMKLLQRHFGNGHLGQGQALYGMLWGAAAAGGAWLAGTLWESVGAGGVFVLAAVPCLLAWAWLRRTSAAEPGARRMPRAPEVYAE